MLSKKGRCESLQARQPNQYIKTRLLCLKEPSSSTCFISKNIFPCKIGVTYPLYDLSPQTFYHINLYWYGLLHQGSN